ncbi:MAG TPA: response regulator [Thermodesulfobacteriota bacterium]|nr:response regulator [Thermodesulfobacteriota bacterium]
MSKSILVVDDSNTELEHISSIIKSKGYEVVTASSGEEALNKANIAKPDLIVLDVVMPGKDGYQTCRELKKEENTKDIKIVMVTSKSQKTDEYWGRKQGADDYITKPFEPDNLLSSISSLI